ncbi:MAG: Rrf2 family transcriptional regulator [Dehalococcoidia bacterium]
MQIALGRKGDYSVRAMIDLARHYGDGRRKARQIARTMDIPERYLPQLLAPLVRGGLLTATAGPDGGYALALPPTAISLLQVIELAEGPLESPECVLRGGPCDWEGICPAHDAWVGGRAAVARHLELTTLAELAERDAAIERGDVAPPPVALHPISVPRQGLRDSQQVAPKRRARAR